MPTPTPHDRAAPRPFSQAERDALHRAIRERRDIRAFRPDPLPAEVLWTLLEAAHRAPSVGFMQPWNFVVITAPDARRAVYEHFREVNEAAAQSYEGDRAAAYRALKLQGILDAPVNLLVTCDRDRGGPVVLGRHTMPEMDLYSTCLAIQNLWLAARVEGVGVGWMSLMEPRRIAAQFGLPPGVEPVAYLCLGYPVEWPDEPILARVGWRAREALAPLVFAERWGAPWREPPERAEVAAEAEAEPPEATLPERLAELPTPRGALGGLEALALRLAAAQGRARPTAARRAIVVMAADHGVAAEGVSAYEPRATAMMIYRFLAGGAVVNALARAAQARLVVADLGVDHAFAPEAALFHAKVRRGSRNLCEEPAMTAAELAAALEAGRAVVEGLGAVDVIALGEMGIGNSTAAAALAAARLGLAPAAVAGAGTGLGPAGMARKVDAIARGLARHGAVASADPTEALRRLGGLEIAGMVGAIEAAAARRTPIVLDGFIAGAAALIAAARTPAVLPFLIAGTRSPEPAHGPVLAALALEPLLDLGLRLGEASGAALALGLVEAACRIVDEVATYAEANVDEPLAPGGRR